MARRYAPVIVIAIVAIAALAFIASRLGSAPVDDGLTAVGDLVVGDCYVYPGDGVEAIRVETAPCAEVHYGEVYGTSGAGDTDACVGLFEAYTGFENYWATDYIIGFIDVDESRMHCYLYAARDFAGSLAAGQ